MCFPQAQRYKHGETLPHLLAWASRGQRPQRCLKIVFDQESALNEATCCLEKCCKPVQLRRNLPSPATVQGSACALSSVHRCIQRCQEWTPHNQQIGDVPQFTDDRAEIAVRNHDALADLQKKCLSGLEQVLLDF